ncbi:MAG: hypothetical protein ACRDP6_22355 [Actinoallomurus sp.]
MTNDRPAGVLAVGYRASSMIVLGLLSVFILLVTAYVGFLAFGIGALFLFVAFVAFALVTLLIVPRYLRALARVLRGAPLLTLDHDGVTFHSAPIAMPWSNIAEIRIDHTAGRGARSDTLVFVPVDERAALKSLRGLPRWFARDGIKRVGGPIFMRVGVLACPIEEILAAVQRLTSAPVRHQHALGRRPKISR